MKKLLFFATAAALMTSCATMNKQQKGTGIGAAGGAAVGALVSKGSIWGILAGAAIGGAAGNLIGKKMDKQAAELKQAIPTAQVERVGEGINITFETGLMFQKSSSALNETYKSDLNSAAEVFAKYPETNILIEGHTDDSGSDEFNLGLSEKRAKAVSDYFKTKGIAAARMSEKWYGESQPKFANDTEENRVKNRRVEIAVYANDEMKKEAKDGKIQ